MRALVFSGAKQIASDSANIAVHVRRVHLVEKYRYLCMYVRFAALLVAFLLLPFMASTESPKSGEVVTAVSYICDKQFLGQLTCVSDT